MKDNRNKYDVERYGADTAPQNPWSIQLCPTYGCNRAPLESKFDEEGKCHGGCDFCGVASLIEKDTDSIKFRFMTVETATAVAKQLNDWVHGRRIEINNFGEPLLNPHIFEIIETFRKNYPSCCIQLQTNGLNYYKDYDEFKKMLDKFYEVGGNLFAIDAYEGTYSPFLEFAKRYKEDTGTWYCDFIHDNPENHTYYRNAGNKARELYIVDDLGDTNVMKAQRHIFNHAGDVGDRAYDKYNIERNLPLDKKCSRVFREIVVGYDGAVSICCHSFRRQMVFGKLPEDNIRDIWNSKAWNIVRAAVYDKKRNLIRPCDICSYPGGFRLGFLQRPEIEINEESLKELYDHTAKYSDYIHYNGFGSVAKDLEGKEFYKIESTMDKNVK